MRGSQSTTGWLPAVPDTASPGRPGLNSRSPGYAGPPELGPNAARGQKFKARKLRQSLRLARLVPRPVLSHPAILQPRAEFWSSHRCETS
jgi:hypothetical protein